MNTEIFCERLYLLRLKAIWAILGASIAQAGPLTISNLALTPAGMQLDIVSDVGVTNEIQSVTNLSQANWAVLTSLVVTQSPYAFVGTLIPPGPQRYYRVMIPQNAIPGAPSGMVLIPAGSFQMGDTFAEGEPYELPVHMIRSLTMGPSP